MEVFHGAHFVRLRCSVRRSKYLAAAEDGLSVCLSGQRAAHNTVWAVEHVAGADVPGAGSGPFVRLRGAYGRYLIATDLQASTGPSHGVTAEQHDHAYEPTPPGWVWQALRRRSSFVIRNGTGRYLRANGRYLRWRTSVTVAGDNASSMMEWKVEVVPPRLCRPTLAADPPVQLARHGGGRGRRAPPPTEGEMTRVIRYVRADESGGFSEGGWSSTRVNSNSLTHLRLTLANRLGPSRDTLHTTLCVRAGRFGRLTPLLINLPVGNDRIDIVIVPHGSPADNALKYPFVDA